MLQHKHANHEAHRLRWTALLGETIRQLLVDPGPVDPLSQHDEFVLQVDDLIEARAEKIVVTRFSLLFRSHLNPRMEGLERITNGPKNESGGFCGVVRWRCLDLKAWIEDRFGVVYHERSVSRLLNELA